MSKQCNGHHQVQTDRAGLAPLHRPTRWGQVLCWAPSLRGRETLAGLARRIYLHLPRLPGLQDLSWKGANTLPGIESLLVYL